VNTKMRTNPGDTESADFLRSLRSLQAIRLEKVNAELAQDKALLESLFATPKASGG